jgi:hypothetical protein
MKFSGETSFPTLNTCTLREKKEGKREEGEKERGQIGKEERRQS